MKKIAIVQSNYIPWKGYFDLISSVDEFILYDDMQYTKRDWRNRNLIKTPNGTEWLSVPVKVKGRYHQSINETEIDGDLWKARHWKSFLQNYKRSPYLNDICDLIYPIYFEFQFRTISELNFAYIKIICNYLNIHTIIKNSTDFKICGDRSEKLLNICLDCQAETYVSGPAAKNYLDETIFDSNHVSVKWFQYGPYIKYPQLWGDFVHSVSILDLLFCCGPDSMKFIKEHDV
jgi:WbqC-like protein family